MEKETRREGETMKVKLTDVFLASLIDEAKYEKWVTRDPRTMKVYLNYKVKQDGNKWQHSLA